MPIVTVLNQKGGVGKTSTCHHLSGTLALQKRRVLLVDNDPQASLTQGFWGPVAARQIAPSDTIAAIYAGDEPFPEQIIRPTGIDGVDLVPGSKRATTHNVPDPHLADSAVQTCLREFLGDIRDRYDLILIDCPPNLHLCSWAALVTSDFLIVPVQPEDYGSQGIIDVQESVAMVAAGANPRVATLGFLLTMINPRLAVHKGYEEMLRGMYAEAVFETTIPIATDFKEAIMQRKPVALFKPKGAAAKTMKALADELDRRMTGQDQVRGAA
ncbi:MAG TPA: ParA family protein [Isosphaeraceae bacterium]|jgi:chromosome partitioning protein|nr:ParA family protein [Isosphaeraceae bacterium]